MSIRLIARDFFRLQQEVEHLEKQLEDAPFEKQTKSDASCSKRE